MPTPSQRTSTNHPTTRRKWSKADCRMVMTLYYESNPHSGGYIQRFHQLWKSHNMFECPGKRLADQARSIMRNNLLSDMELAEIRATMSIPTDQSLTSHTNLRDAVASDPAPPPEVSTPPLVLTQRQTNSASSSSGPPLMARKKKTKRTETSERRKWSKEECKTLLHLYYESIKPSSDGFRRRLHRLWMDEGLFKCTEQRLADQVRSVMNRNILSDMELAELRELSEISRATPNNVNQPLTITTTDQEPLPDPTDSLTQVLHHYRNLADCPSVPTTLQEEPPATSNIFNHAAIASDINPDLEGLSESQLDLRSKLLTLMRETDNIEVKILRHVNRKKLTEKTKAINTVLPTVPTHTITDTNTLLLAAAHVVREELGEKVSVKKKVVKDPLWKRRIEAKIMEHRSDISRIEELKKKKILKSKVVAELHRRHPFLKKKGYSVVI